MAFNSASKSVFVTRLVISGILFSTVVNDELVARPLIFVTPGILFSTAVKADFLTNSLTSGIFFSILSILSSKSDPSFSYLVLETKFLLSILFTLLTNLSYSVFFYNIIFYNIA